MANDECGTMNNEIDSQTEATRSVSNSKPLKLFKQ
jgi:hypothetical protein